MDTLSAMKVFCSVVENDSLAAAARLLNVSPSVVSKQLSALEDRLGVRLLNRTTRRVSVTEEGAGAERTVELRVGWFCALERLGWA